MADPYARFEAARLVLALRQAGVTEQRLSEAMEKTPRDRFVPVMFRESAWDNVELPIDCGQVLTRPVTVAQVIGAMDVQREHTVLEIGTGTGYPAAVFSRLARRVYSIDRYRTLIEQARAALDDAGAARVELRHSDGLAGWPEAAPFDRIVLWGAVADVPVSLIAQLAPGGRMVAPVTRDGEQQLVLFHRVDGETTETILMKSRFLPLQPGVAREL
jgi:protein-L-isoaspartate(D-aspartate) O-methyltransferase